jgi:hypothetical protein
MGAVRCHGCAFISGIILFYGRISIRSAGRGNSGNAIDANDINVDRRKIEVSERILAASTSL